MSKMMYVWETVGDLTNSYHDGGGVVVIADNMEAARELLKTHGARKGCEAFTASPDFSAPVETNEDKVFIFPDAGCC